MKTNGLWVVYNPINHEVAFTLKGEVNLISLLEYNKESGIGFTFIRKSIPNLIFSGVTTEGSVLWMYGEPEPYNLTLAYTDKQFENEVKNLGND